MSNTALQWIDVFPEPCLLVSPEGVIARANPVFLRLFGNDSASISDRDIVSLTAGEEGKTRDYLKLCSKNRNFVIGSLCLITREGRQVFRCEGATVIATNLQQSSLILLRLKPQQSAVAKFTVLNDRIRELTKEVRQRIEAEEALTRSEALFRELADAMPQIVWAARPDGTTDYFNRRWSELTGTGREELANNNWLSILHPDDQQKCWDEWCKCVRTGKNYQIEYRFKFPHENKYRWHLGRALPVRDAEGNIIRWFGTCTDIDEQKTAEENLERAVAERTASLRAAMGQLEEFSYSVSHDLRTPVRAMQGYAKALLVDYAEKLDENGRHYLERIIRGGERMDKLIMDVLTFSQIARSEIQLLPVSINRVIHEVIDQYPAMQLPHAEIEVTALSSVIGHEPSLTQVISNLLANAVKFVPEGTTPKIRIRSEAFGSDVRVWFEDNGIGIAPEHQQKIFGLFERIHPEKKYPGTGIGLSVVRKALERMGGQVGVVSDGVSGSKFWIQLRAAEYL